MASRTLLALSVTIVTLLAGDFSQAFAQFIVVPQGTLNTFAYCVNQFGQFIPSCTVLLSSSYYPNSGGHIHNNPTHTAADY